MSQDPHVRYFRSSLHGQKVYGFVHSAIEWVFVRTNPGGHRREPAKS